MGLRSNAVFIPSIADNRTRRNAGSIPIKVFKPADLPAVNASRYNRAA
jgi:hypothetical protein